MVPEGWEDKIGTEGGTPKEMGSRLGISRQAMNQKLKASSFSYRDVIILFHELELTDEEILRYITYK